MPKQLIELSKKTLGSYIKGATVDVALHGMLSGHNRAGAKNNSFKADTAAKQEKKMMKRQAGIGKAADKLTKEQTMSLVSLAARKDAVSFKEEFENKMAGKITVMLDEIKMGMGDVVMEAYINNGSLHAPEETPRGPLELNAKKVIKTGNISSQPSGTDQVMKATSSPSPAKKVGEFNGGK